jgi:hypothetical protein
MQTISDVIKKWRESWELRQCKAGLPSDDEDWKMYVDSLSTSAVLELLDIYSTVLTQTKS